MFSVRVITRFNASTLLGQRIPNVTFGSSVRNHHTNCETLKEQVQTHKASNNQHSQRKHLISIDKLARIYKKWNKITLKIQELEKEISVQDEIFRQESSECGKFTCTYIQPKLDKYPSPYTVEYLYKVEHPSNTKLVYVDKTDDIPKFVLSDGRMSKAWMYEYEYGTFSVVRFHNEDVIHWKWPDYTKMEEN